MQQEMMRIYKEEKVNPLGGCLPIFIQIPVFIALYWVLLSSVEMRNAPWIGWIRDLSTPDPFFILPVVMTLTTLLQTALNPVPPDPMQAKMMWFMPLIFSVMFFFFPAGLVLYWITNNVLSIAQQWLINVRMGVPPEFNLPKFKAKARPRRKEGRAAFHPGPARLIPAQAGTQSVEAKRPGPLFLLALGFPPSRE
jgi:YidC/Oxa1 family membrane protein insertase